jgi:hypothetical protein
MRHHPLANATTGNRWCLQARFDDDVLPVDETETPQLAVKRSDEGRFVAGKEADAGDATRTDLSA